jgi:hypothetical protein
MGPRERMRSYRPFLSAIPHRRAGYPRVTHPSATRVTPERAPSSDLHVLRTPPAFVLSQDQTRHPSSLERRRIAPHSDLLAIHESLCDSKVSTELTSLRRRLTRLRRAQHVTSCPLQSLALFALLPTLQLSKYWFTRFVPSIERTQAMPPFLTAPPELTTPEGRCQEG